MGNDDAKVIGSSPRTNSPITLHVFSGGKPIRRSATNMQALLDSSEAFTQADIACQEGISRARVTQVMGLLRLAPEIQEQILSLPDSACRTVVTERILRPIGIIENYRDQIREFQRFLVQASG